MGHVYDAPQMEVARIRYFCQLTLEDAPLPSIAYLAALAQTTWGVRALSIFGMPAPVGPWAPYAALFATPVAPVYLNVVCALPGMPMGTPRKASELAGSMRGPGGLTHAAGKDDVVYLPQTALAGLFTVGVKNVAITVPPPRDSISDEEWRALERYDLVVTPTETMAELLETDHGVKAVAVEPAYVASALSHLVPS